MKNIGSAIDINFLLGLFSKSSDILIRRVEINGKKELTVYIFCVDGLTDSDSVNQTILRPISLDTRLSEFQSEEEVFSRLVNGAIYNVFLSEEANQAKIVQKVLSGQTALIFPTLKKSIIFDVRSFAKRSIDEPEEETVTKGAKDCFIEALRTNTAQLRRRIRSPYLVIEQGIIGEESRTDYAIAYMSDICDMSLVRELKKRIEKIGIDNLVTPAFIEEYICDNRSSIFPQIIYTERPDRASSNLTDGRVGLIVDGIPFVYLLPCQFVSLMQTPDDYAQNYIVGSSLRFMRWLAILVSLLLPAYYISAATFHTELLPLQLAMAIQNAKQSVPFSSFVEVIALLIAFEVLMDAGIRLSNKVGQAMSVVGALVVGQAAVDAKLVSPAALIVVAITAVSGFTIPGQDLRNSFRVCRFLIAVASSICGLYGLFFGAVFTVIHLCSLSSYGIAYLMPFVDCENETLKDTLFRFPVREFILRPHKIADKNKVKQK